VIVHSGQAVVLGGLILETRNDAKTGIPILMDIPLLGKLFSSTSEDIFRTELIITVSPTIIENQLAVQQITEELRKKMSRATEFENAVNSEADD
jgi:general secretion pathway protein D